jgi:iron(III) transport system ATP-binding protein
MQISSFATRMPNQLSGGQQQRVALARALVISPDVLLMDEPLSNLDAKLRLEMRSVIRDIQKTVGITTVYVTHDQEEAMAISDTIAVMKDGIIQHIGTPREIYQRPKNLFVASFIGRTNILSAKIKENALIIGDTYRLSLEHLKRLPDSEVLCSIRPEDFILTQAGEDGVEGVLKGCSYLGLNTHYVVDIGGGVLVDVIEESSLDEELQPGQKILLQVKGHRINLFDKEGSINLVRSETREKAK